MQFDQPGRVIEFRNPKGYCKLNNDSALITDSKFENGGHVCTVNSPATDKPGSGKSLLFSADGKSWIGGPAATPVSLNMISGASVMKYKL